MFHVPVHYRKDAVLYSVLYNTGVSTIYWTVLLRYTTRVPGIFCQTGYKSSLTVPVDIVISRIPGSIFVYQITVHCTLNNIQYRYEYTTVLTVQTTVQTTRLHFYVLNFFFASVLYQVLFRAMMVPVDITSTRSTSLLLIGCRVQRYKDDEIVHCTVEENRHSFKLGSITCVRFLP
jgi:hypothetical protein